MSRVTRRIDGLPVWSSGITLGLTRNGGIGFLEAHWPEIPSTVLEEARRLAERVKEGWRPPERQGGKPESVEAGVIHSPAAGFVMDIYPAIRVIYTDISMGKKATLYLDCHGNNLPIPRQFDKPPDLSPGPRGERQEGGGLDQNRERFRALLLANPNYFGNLTDSPFEPKVKMSLNTTYEELGCVGYQPQFRRLEGVVD